MLPTDTRRRERPMIRLLACLAVFLLTLAPFTAAQAPSTPYFPDRFDWQRRTPEQAGFDAAALKEAIAFAVANDNPAPRDQALAQALSFGAREPFDAIIGPMQERAPLNGLIVHKGYVVAEWGDTRRADMAHSVTKTFLTTVVGLAWQKGLIRSVDDRVRDYMPPGVDLFDAPHNQAITWDHLLRQSSDWQGTLWDKPDWADRPEGPPAGWTSLPRHQPGTRFEYNDVRVNVLALAALYVLRRPLPDVLREELMEPIGASNTWRWHGYDNSWIALDGRRVQSVSGGGHWGGGMFISAWDMARFGYLFLRNGRWQDRQIVPEAWIRMARTPGPANAEYGHANWYLNTGRKPLPDVPESSVTFRGNGANIVYVDWENDLVVVVRWIGGGSALNDFLARVLGAIRTGRT
jgi:CubicO group peptidase (beta-lactamase class C family)